MMSEKRLYDVIDNEEPRGQSVSYQGIPCTARHCCTNLNRLTEENEQLKEEKERLQKDMENLQEVVAELGATLLVNGFEIEINGENLSELIDDE